MLVTIATGLKIAAASFVLAGVADWQDRPNDKIFFEGVGLGVMTGAILAQGNVKPLVNGVIAGAITGGYIFSKIGK